jgi:hypothetical protein
VAIKRDGFLENPERIFPVIVPCFPRNSMCNLSDDTNAISIPENMAENSNETNTMEMLV